MFSVIIFTPRFSEGVQLVAKKHYPNERVSEIDRLLAEAPTLEPRFTSHDAAMAEWASRIRELHFKKNYDVKQITALLATFGVRTNQAAVRLILKHRKGPIA